MGCYEFGAPSLGLEDNLVLKKFKLYPNPVWNTLNIRLERVFRKS